MRIDDNENPQFNGGALEEEEARLLALGTDDVEETQAETPAAETSAVETPAVETPAAPVAVAVPDAPAAPKDFEAEAAAIEAKYDAGDMTVLEMQKEMRKLTLEEVDYKQQLAAWEQQKAAIEQANEVATTTAKQSAELEWARAATAFEQANKDFLADPVRHAQMQKEINDLLELGVPLSHEDLLQRAFEAAAAKRAWTIPPKGDTKLTREQLGEALNGRGGKPVQGLGDMPNAHVEAARGNADFAALDALPIDQLEETYARMTPAQQEKFLRDAPGATATGRD